MQTADKQKQLKELEMQAQVLRREIAVDLKKVRRPRTPLWTLVAAFLQNQPRKTADLDNIALALTRGGHDLGKYPKRSVALCVSNSIMGAIFEVEVKGTSKLVKLISMGRYSHLQKLGPEAIAHQQQRGALTR